MGSVVGFCPMGCGETLVLDDRADGHVVCARPDCPRPSAVDEILADSETEHVVELTATGFTVLHPLRERLDRALLECKFTEQLRLYDGPQRCGLPGPSGRYRVTRHDNDPTSESFRSDSTGWDWEEIS